jgi:hypothetical protein
MLLLVILLLALAGAGMGVYVAGNGGGSYDVSFLGQHWSGVDAWLPPLIIASTFAALGLLAISYGWVRIRMLKHGNDLLRSEIARLRGVTDAATETAAAERRLARQQMSAAARDDGQSSDRIRRWFGVRRSSNGDSPEAAAPAAAAGQERVAH